MNKKSKQNTSELNKKYKNLSGPFGTHKINYFQYKLFNYTHFTPFIQFIYLQNPTIHRFLTFKYMLYTYTCMYK